MNWLAKVRLLIPNREQLRTGRLTRWLAPWLGHPRLWRGSRRGVALGVAIGIFFGLLVPVAQIPLSAAASVALRANIPAAMGSTLITNPITFAPIYYMAYRTGLALTGEEKSRAELAQNLAAIDPDWVPPQDDAHHPGLWQRLQALGKPLLLGLAIFAVAGGLLAYVLVSLAWRAWVLLKRKRRRHRQ